MKRRPEYYPPPGRGSGWDFAPLTFYWACIVIGAVLLLFGAF